jgi:hypothetical protein
MYLRNFLHPISTPYGHLDVSKLKKEIRVFSGLDFGDLFLKKNQI